MVVGYLRTQRTVGFIIFKMSERCGFSTRCRFLPGWSFIRGSLPRPGWLRVVLQMDSSMFVSTRKLSSISLGSISLPSDVGVCLRISFLHCSSVGCIEVLLYSVIVELLSARLSLDFGIACISRCYLWYGTSGVSLCSARKLVLCLPTVHCGKMRFAISF